MWEPVRLPHNCRHRPIIRLATSLHRSTPEITRLLAALVGLSCAFSTVIFKPVWSQYPWCMATPNGLAGQFGAFVRIFHIGFGGALRTHGSPIGSNHLSFWRQRYNLRNQRCKTGFEPINDCFHWQSILKGPQGKAKYLNQWYLGVVPLSNLDKKSCKMAAWGGCRKDWTLLITQPCDPIGGGRQDEIVEQVIVVQLGAGRHLFIGLVTVECRSLFAWCIVLKFPL